MDESRPTPVDPAATLPEGESTGKPADAILARLSLIVSTTTSIGALLVTLSSDALSSSILLWVASALCAACLGALYLSMKPKRGTQAARAFGVSVGVCGALLLGAWGYAFRDQIRFSPWATGLSRAPSVLVADGVSRSLVTSKMTEGPPQRLVAFLDRLVEEPHRTRICSLTECPDKSIALVVTGVVNDNKAVLDLAPSNPSSETLRPAPSTLQDVLTELQSSIMASAFDSGPGVVRLETTPPALADVLRTAYHLAAAMRMVHIGDRAGAAPHVQHFLELMPALPGDDIARDWVVDGTLFAASYYAQSPDLTPALRALETAARALPAEPRLQIAEAYVRWKSGQSAALEALSPAKSETAALANTLHGLAATRRGDFWSAGEHFEEAVKASAATADGRRIFWMHLAAAHLFADTSGDARTRGERIVDHAQKADAIDPNVRLVRLLEAYGLVLNGNGARAEQVLGAILATDKDPGTRDLCDYWSARGYAETGEDDRARALLDRLLRGPSPRADALGLMAELSRKRTEKGPITQSDYDAAIEESIKYAERAVKLDVAEPKSNRILALYQADQAGRLLRSQRESLEQDALTHFAKAIEGGGADAETYARLSTIFRDLARAQEAEDSSRKYLDMECRLGSERPLARLIADARDALERRSEEGRSLARDKTNQVLDWINSHDKDTDRALHRTELLTLLAVLWYEDAPFDDSGLEHSLSRSAAIYVQMVDALEHSSFPGCESVLATAKCNLGFIYIDQHRSGDAINAFTSSMALDKQADPSPDCEAGLAVALRQGGQKTLALAEYRLARSHDDSYSPERIEVIRNVNFWSATACDGLMALAKQNLLAASTQ